MLPGNPGKWQIHFPAPGTVLEFYKIRKCPGENFVCEKKTLNKKPE